MTSGMNFVNHWFKSSNDLPLIYKVLSHVKGDKYLYNVLMISDNGHSWECTKFLSDSIHGIQIDARKARAWRDRVIRYNKNIKDSIRAL